MPGLFADPLAYDLLHPEERVAVDQVRAGTPPQGWAPRSEYESVLACAEVMAPRTVVIDEAVRSHRHLQLVTLGAGLDSRAWRMHELADVDVTEIDHPASQRDKQARMGRRPPLARTFRFQPADLATDDLGEALDACGHDSDVPTTWLWEGVIPYLGRREVIATLRTLGERSARGSALILNYQSPSLRAALGRGLVRALSVVGRDRPITVAEPWRTLLAPEQAAGLLANAGFGVQADEDLLGVAARLSHEARFRTSLRSGRVAVAIRH